MSNKTKNWWQIAGNLIAIPAGVITLVQFFIDRKLDVRTLVPELPVSTTASLRWIGFFDYLSVGSVESELVERLSIKEGK